MRRFALCSLVMICLLLLAAPAFGASQEFPALTGRVVDNAGLFSQAQEEELTQALAELENATTDQFVVATIDSTNGQDIFAYATELGHSWKLGTADKDNGALLLIAFQDRKLSIVTGYGLEGDLPDIVCNQIITGEISPRFKQGQYYEGVKAGLIAMMAKAAPEFKPNFTVAAAPATQRSKSTSFWPILVILFVIFSALGSAGSRGRNRSYWRRRGLIIFPPGGFFGGGGSSGGGGFGGGGGGGFSGGGGGFGGGGSSGGW